ncbi:MAG: hypothetical protein HC853_08810 [Anaerolineae bacterium]|nr:hypothetical protein [Anaerolineae bacterium]
MPDTKLLVLIADDNADDREAVRHYLPKEFEIVETDNDADTRRILTERPVYIAFVDLFLDEKTTCRLALRFCRTSSMCRCC